MDSPAASRPPSAFSLKALFALICVASLLVVGCLYAELSMKNAELSMELVRLKYRQAESKRVANDYFIAALLSRSDLIGLATSKVPDLEAIADVTWDVADLESHPFLKLLTPQAMSIPGASSTITNLAGYARLGNLQLGDRGYVFWGKSKPALESVPNRVGYLVLERSGKILAVFEVIELLPE